MTKIKICGITNLEDARFAALLGVDYLGFIFSKSPRRITPSKAKNIIKALPKRVKKVGVFVNSPAAYINQVAKNIGLDLIQLHGEETPEFCKKIKKPVIKAFRIKNKLEPRLQSRVSVKSFLGKLKDYKVYALLLDGYHPTKLGGTGKKIDWKIAKTAKVFGEIFLSGGLSPKNLAKAIKTAQPFAVDLNSGLEKYPGKKDLSLVKRAIEIARSL